MTHPQPTTPSGDSDDRPLWRQHFPVESSADSKRSRREFIGGVAVAGGAIICGQAALNAVAPTEPDEDNFVQIDDGVEPLVLQKKFPDLRDGEAVPFHHPDHRSPGLLVRIEDSVVAFAQKCTHLACPVIPNPDAGRLDCPCHKGAFDLRSGEPVSGPPRAALPRFPVAVADDGTIQIG